MATRNRTRAPLLWLSLLTLCSCPAHQPSTYNETLSQFEGHVFHHDSINLDDLLTKEAQLQWAQISKSKAYQSFVRKDGLETTSMCGGQVAAGKAPATLHCSLGHGGYGLDLGLAKDATGHWRIKQMALQANEKF